MGLGEALMELGAGKLLLPLGLNEADREQSAKRRGEGGACKANCNLQKEVTSG